LAFDPGFKVAVRFGRGICSRTCPPMYELHVPNRMRTSRSGGCARRAGLKMLRSWKLAR